MGRTKGTPHHIRNLTRHKHNNTIKLKARKKRLITYRHRGDPTLLLKNEIQRARFKRATSRMSRYKNFSVWGEGTSGASTLIRLTPPLRHKLLSRTTQDNLFRNPSVLQEMFRNHKLGTPFSFHTNSVKFILTLAHGYIVNTMSCPRNMGIFHIGENDARGKPISGRKGVINILNTILGLGGVGFSTFFTRKLGGTGTHTGDSIMDSIAYSTYGPDQMPSYYLVKEGPSDPLNNTSGVFDITTSLENGTFKPYDFSYISDDVSTPDQRSPGIYKELTPLTELLQNHSLHQYHPEGSVFRRGTSLETLCRTLKDPAFSPYQGVRYDNGLIFMIVICCTGLDPALPSGVASAIVSRPPAYTSYSTPLV